MAEPPMPTRRRFLRVGTVSVLGLALVACSDDDSDTAAAGGPEADPGGATTPVTTPSSDASGETDLSTTAGPGTTATTTDATAATTDAPVQAALAELTAADFAGLGTCALLPESTAGPFALDEQLDRRDITEGYPGHPMRLGLRVLDEACAPVAGAAVEIWHTDASGDYSAFTDNGDGLDEGPGTTFMRGTQTADADGIVEFLTIYPGWYRGRAVHIHLRVHLDGTIVHTGQLYFDDGYTATVYAAAPYSDNGLPDTPTAADRIAGDPASDGTLLSTVAGGTTRGPGTLALLNLGIAS
jgi:protocatechuate 3,4-dioxygenase beta subunit